MANFYGASDLGTMFAEFGVPVEFVNNGFIHLTKGIVDEVGLEAVDTGIGPFTATLTSVIIQTGSLPGLISGVQVKVNNKNYSVVALRQEDDGATTRVFVRA